MSRKKQAQKRMNNTIIGVLVVGIIAFATVAYISGNKGGTATNIANPTYTANIKPILDQKCVTCHGSSGVRSTSPFDAYQGVMKVVQPGSDQSQLVLKTQPGGSMSSKLSADEAALIKTWVSQGAKE